MGQRNAVFGEVQRRLVHLGLPEDVRQAVLAMLHSGVPEGVASDAGESRGDSPPDGGAVEVRHDDFAVRVAQTFYRTALQATQALGTGSISTLIMLFDLFVAHEQKRPISVSSLCIASGAASTTALRQIGLLEARGFVTRESDPQDRRRSWVTPTPRALTLIHALIAEWSTMLQA